MSQDNRSERLGTDRSHRHQHQTQDDGGNFAADECDGLDQDAALMGIDEAVSHADLQAAFDLRAKRTRVSSQTQSETGRRKSRNSNSNGNDSDDGGDDLPRRRRRASHGADDDLHSTMSRGSARAMGSRLASEPSVDSRVSRGRPVPPRTPQQSKNAAMADADLFEDMDTVIEKKRREWFIVTDEGRDTLNEENNFDPMRKQQEFLREMHERDVEDGLTTADGTITRHALQLLVNALYEEFCPSEDDISPDTVRKWMYSHFTDDKVPNDAKAEFRDLHLSHDDARVIDANRIQAVYSLRRNHVGNLHYQMIKRKMCERKSEGMLTNEQKISHISEVMTYCYMCIENEHLARAAISDDARNTIPERVRVFYFQHMQQMDVKDTPYMQLVVHILRQLYLCGYRRRGDACFEQIVTPEGHKTRAWKMKMSIERFVIEKTAKDTFAAQWANLMASQNNLHSLVKWLKVCNEPEFPELEPDRRIFAFRNGIYFASLDQFMTYEEVNYSVQRNVTACKYFNYDFDTTVYCYPRERQSAADDGDEDLQDVDDDDEEEMYEDPLQIPTPNASKVFDIQQLDPEVEFYLWAFMGRCIFDVGELDKWQITPFIKGLAGTGKSTIGRIIARFYNMEDLAIIGNSFEERFGLQSMHAKFICICYEMSKKVPLAQTDIQSMASGEEMLIARKFQEAMTVQWKVPSFYFGNRIGNWLDTAGSMQRRLPTFEFFHTVRNSDPNLIDKINKEMPNIIRKCVKCYLALAREHGRDEFWTFCPNYFKQTRDNLRKMVNPFHAFMEEAEDFVYDADTYVPLEYARRVFYNFCRDNNVTKVNFDADVYEEEFARRDIKIRKNTNLVWKGRRRKGIYIVGFTIKIDDARQDGDHTTGIFGFKKNMEMLTNGGGGGGAAPNKGKGKAPPITGTPSSRSHGQHGGDKNRDKQPRRSRADDADSDFDDGPAVVARPMKAKPNPNPNPNPNPTSRPTPTEIEKLQAISAALPGPQLPSSPAPASAPVTAPAPTPRIRDAAAAGLDNEGGPSHKRQRTVNEEDADHE